MFNQKSVKWSFLITSMFVLAACGYVTPSPSLPTSNTSSSTNDIPPVYKGMFASRKAQQQSNSKNLDLDNQNYLDKELSQISSSTEIPTQNNISYYANPEEDIIIRISLFNPDNQVILRFSLNKVVYQSYEFQKGSNSENLYIFIRTSKDSGVHDLTIDEIKFVENTTNIIKDAIFEADTTIKIAVRYSNGVEITKRNEEIGFTEFNLNLTVIDKNNFTEIYNNKPTLYLFEESKSIHIYTKVLDLGDNLIEINDLKPKQKYEYSILMTVNYLDGLGNKLDNILSDGFETKAPLKVEIEKVDLDNITFNVLKQSEHLIYEIVDIKLFEGKTSMLIAENINVGLVENLEPDTQYKLQLNYKITLNNQIFNLIEEVTFTTKAYKISELYLNLQNINNIMLKIYNNIPELVFFDLEGNSNKFYLSKNDYTPVKFDLNFFPVILEKRGNFIFIKLASSYELSNNKYGVTSTYEANLIYLIIDIRDGKIHAIDSADNSLNTQYKNDLEELFNRLSVENTLTWRSLHLLYVQSDSPFFNNNQYVIESTDGNSLYYFNYQKIKSFRFLNNNFSFSETPVLNKQESYAYHYFDRISGIYYYKNDLTNSFVGYNLVKGYINHNVEIPSFLLPNGQVFFKDKTNGSIYTYDLNNVKVIYNFELNGNTRYMAGPYGHLDYQYNPLNTNEYLIGSDKEIHHSTQNSELIKVVIDSTNKVVKFENFSSNITILRGITYFKKGYYGFYENKLYYFDLANNEFEIIDLSNSFKSINLIYFDEEGKLIISGINNQLEYLSYNFTENLFTDNNNSMIPHLISLDQSNYFKF